MIDAIILNYNDYKTTIRLINEINDFDVIDHIIVVDNCSTNELYNKLKELSSKKISVIETDKNGGYGYGNNYGMRFSYKTNNPDYYLICNPDVHFSNKTIKNSIDFLIKNDDYGIVAPSMLNKDNKKEKMRAWKIPNAFEYALSFGTIISHIYHPNMYDYSELENEKFIQVEIVPGSLLIVKANAIKESKYYDENVFLYAEEMILGIKMKNANYKTALLLNDYYVHEHSVSINKNVNKIDKRILMNRSKYYALTHYLNSNKFDKLIAKILSILSLIEATIWQLISSIINN